MSKQSVFQRVSEEHEALWDNIEKLQAFRDGKQPSDVSDRQWLLLKKQLKAMRKYNKILARRIEDLYGEAFGPGTRTVELESKNVIRGAQPDYIIIDEMQYFENEEAIDAENEVVFNGDTAKVANKDYQRKSDNEILGHHWSDDMPELIKINHETGEWTPVQNTVRTPGQLEGTENYDLSTAKTQSDKDFMKDDINKK